MSGQIETMPTVKIHYDGWICLPASLCRALGLNKGDRLAAELVDGALALHPVARHAGQDLHIETTASPAIDRPKGATPTGDAMPARRKPGRPRKNAVAEPAPFAPTKRLGRPPKAMVTPEPEPAAEPVVRREPWILRKKVDLLSAVQVVDKPAPPQRRPEWRSDDGFPFVERRPFRQVEVRKLGPGRGHNRSQPLTVRQRG
jgi:bifunctional DNA-binding transcriptional regulator/antitoxin component of YhaV-PrlF toxin-antitoxin module